MANKKLKVIAMPNNDKYEVIDWYGTSSTSATETTKVVSISGFTNDSYQAGLRIAIKFTYGHRSNVPYLNINNLGSKAVYSDGNHWGSQYEWSDGEIITFVYSGNSWLIENGSHASTTCFGRTILTNTISSDETMALTPKAVYDAGYLTLADLPIYDGTVE